MQAICVHGRGEHHRPDCSNARDVIDFIAWVAGKNPNLRTIFAAYSSELSTRTNLDIQRILGNPFYQRIFPGTNPGWQCNTEHIEYMDCTGDFRNTTVNGAINGFGFHLGAVDDPIKGRREPSSKTARDMTWNWLTDDFGSRMDAKGGVVGSAISTESICGWRRCAAD
jgi:hypothetical protein